MNDDLREIYERLAYCDEEFQQLSGQVRSFFKQHKEVRAFAMPAELGVQMRLTAAPPGSFKLKAGGIVHEARSCLDALAVRLAARNGKNSKGVYFPISKSADIFADDGRQKIRKLTPEHQQKIIDIRPFPPDNAFLFGMHEFDRIRKHVRLNATFAGAGGMVLYSGENVGVISTHRVELTPDWQLVAVFTRSTVAKVDFIAQITLSEPPELDGDDLITSVQRFNAEVRRIADLFREGSP